MDSGDIPWWVTTTCSFCGLFESIEDESFGFHKKFYRVFRVQQRPVRVSYEIEIVHTHAGLLHFKNIVPIEVSPKCGTDKKDAPDRDGFVFEEMDVFREGKHFP